MKDMSREELLARIGELERRVRELSNRSPGDTSPVSASANRGGGSASGSMPGLNTLRQEVARLRSELQSGLKALETNLYGQLEALIGLYRQLDQKPPLPPLRGWALSPDAARILVSFISETRPSVILELGSGASTVLLGHLAAQAGIQEIISIDHDELWYSATLQSLRYEELDEMVDLRFAPLVDIPVEGEEYPWYSIEVDTLPAIDMVIVDGPPGWLRPDSRFPALPLLRGVCTDGASFVLDDLIREDEQHVVRRWLEMPSTTLIMWDMTPEKGMAIVRAGGNDVLNAD